MANLTESSTFEAAIYKLKTSDPIEAGDPVFDGGEPTGGWANAQAQQLANRTKWLKDFVDLLGDYKAEAEAYGDNMDNLFTSGVYLIQNGASNKPASGTFICHVISVGADNNAVQRATLITGNANINYARTYDNSAEAWSAWRADDKPEVISITDGTVVKYPDGRIEQYGTIDVTFTLAASGSVYVDSISSEILHADFEAIEYANASPGIGTGTFTWVGRVFAQITSPNLSVEIFYASSSNPSSATINYHIKGTYTP